MGTRVNYSGLIIAGIGFFLTRFTVALAIYEDPVRFYLAGVIPLALGLGLAAFGIALTVADVKASLVRTISLWCVIGVGTMSVLAILTLLGSATPGMSDLENIRAQTYLSTFLIGGSVGGTLTGVYASRNRQQRGILQQQANRLVVLNRLLRHEILNALTPLHGFATLDNTENPDAKRVVEDRLDGIEQTVEEVKYLTQHAGHGKTVGTPISLEESLRESITAVRERYPDASLSRESVPENLKVDANERLAQVFINLLENAIAHAKDENPTVEVTVARNTVRVSVTDDGSGLPESQQSLLETGDIEEFDNPKMGYGLNVVRLLVESYGGEIETDHDDTGTRITVVLPRAETEGTGLRPSQSHLAGMRTAMPHLTVAFVAAVLAGVFYGAVSEFLGGSIAGIGVFYGTANPVVGWITHEFHSIVFGFVFVSLVSLAPDRYRNNLATYVLVGIGWAVVLWIGAAGIIAPIWLRLLGIPASIPSFSVTSLVSHLAWGLSLGLLTAWGYRLFTPWSTRLGERLRYVSERV